MLATVFFGGLLLAAPAAAQQQDVTFLVMGKTTNHRQSASGELAQLNYHFFAEVFVKEGGKVTDAFLTFPGGKKQAFEDLGFVQEVHGGRYDNEEELDRLYPNGDYVFSFKTPSGNVDHRVMSVTGTGEGKSRIPNPVTITLNQDGKRVSPGAVDPAKDLTVTWSEFKGAGSDPNGILDDLLFVVMGNCHGDRTVHSGRPFEGTDFLSYTATSYTIPAEKLAPGEPHQLTVEQAIVDTSEEDSIAGLVTYAATTFLDFQTTGEASAEACPLEMPRIDAGQTDRPAKER